MKIIEKTLEKNKICFSFFISWVARQWDILHLVFNWENGSWDQTIVFFYFFNMFFVFVFSCFLLCFIFFLFFDQKMQKLKIIENTCFLKKKEIANVLQGCFWCNVLWKNLRLFARGHRCQNKVRFDRPQPEQIK